MHDSNQNLQNNFKTLQLFEDDNNDTNAIIKSLILSKNMTSEISTLIIKKLKESFINKNHKSYQVSDTFQVSILTAKNSRESHVNQNQKFQIINKNSNEFKDKKDSENKESHQIIKKFLN